MPLELHIDGSGFLYDSRKEDLALFGVLYGGLFLKEEGFKRRLFATSLMVLGVVMITVLG
jgi:hypothetical protein